MCEKEVPRYLTIAEEMKECPIPCARYRQMTFRWLGKSVVASCGDWDWFQHWPLKTRLQFAFNLLFGRKTYTLDRLEEDITPNKPLQRSEKPAR